MFNIIVSPLLFGVRPILASNIAFSIALKHYLSNGLMQSCLASGIDILASCLSGVSAP